MWRNYTFIHSWWEQKIVQTIWKTDWYFLKKQNKQLQSVCMCVTVAQSCLTLCDPMDCSSPSSSVHRILQARILKWVTIPFSRGSSWPRGQNPVSCIAIWATREALGLVKTIPIHVRYTSCLSLKNVISVTYIICDICFNWLVVKITIKNWDWRMTVGSVVWSGRHSS